MKTFKEKLLTLKDRFDSFSSKNITLNNSIKDKLDNSVDLYHSMLQQTCAYIAQANYKQIMKAMIKLNKRNNRKTKKEETTNGNK